MSGIGELAYTVLLGWMRAVFDWGWSLVAGTGNSGAWQWFLSNWKIWLVVLVVGGLVVDWLIWLVRWRPHRLLLSRFRRAPATAPAAEEAWDQGEGFYAPEMAVDTEEGSAEADWAEPTFAALSEIDPDWAGKMVMDTGDELLYDPNYDPAHNTSGFYVEEMDVPGGASIVQEMPSASGYWDETPDEVAYDEPAGMPTVEESPAPYVPAYEPLLSDIDDDDEPMPAATANDTQPDGPPPGFDPFAPYDAYDPEAVAAFTSEQPVVEAAPEAAAAPEDAGPLLYGRPGLWPGMRYPGDNADAAEPEPPASQAYDPLFNPDAPQPPASRRRRRRMRESVDDGWQPEDPILAEQDEAAEPMPSWMDLPEPTPEAAQGYDLGYPDSTRKKRPERVVKPATTVPEPPEEEEEETGRRWGRKKGVRTVTGKPAVRRGLFRLTTASDEPISGLPPMEVGDAFRPSAYPQDPDFEADDGEEYDR